MADADRLQAIQDETSRALEDRITELMANVLAARQLNRQISDAEGQIDMGRADLAALEEELGGLDAGSEDHAALSEQVEQLRVAIADTEAYRDDLVDALGKLAEKIGG